MGAELPGNIMNECDMHARYLAQRRVGILTVFLLLVACALSVYEGKARNSGYFEFLASQYSQKEPPERKCSPAH
jgi:hypothetical protein